MQSKDFEWFVENFDKLSAIYGNAFIAIKNKKVLGSYSSYSEGVRETLKSEEIGSFIIQQCGTDETAYTNYISSMNFA